MPLLELRYSDQHESLGIVRFEAYEAMSQPFEITLWLHSLNPAVELTEAIGKDAEFRMVTGRAFVQGLGARRWQGICCSFEQTEATPNGVSIYVMRLVPRLWLLGQNRNNRIFQHKSVPAIVDEVLNNWSIERRWNIDEPRYPTLNFRVQYAESDLTFVQRLLEEAGISYYFLDDTPDAINSMESFEAREFNAKDASILVMTDAPHLNEPRLGGVIEYTETPSTVAVAGDEYVAEVTLKTGLLTGKTSFRDYDFRLQPEYPLIAHASSDSGDPQQYEHYHYLPGGFRREGTARGGTARGGTARGGTPHANDKAVVGTDEEYGRRRAQLKASAAHAARQRIRLDTNVSDLSPATVFQIFHPHPSLDNRPLLALEQQLSGESQGRWYMSVNAVFADTPYVPPSVTPAPRIEGIQSALVVGPPGEEIHTDEYGRVRVQFHWDRQGSRDDNSSCWLRVSQAWAGTGYGLLNLPRVGQEVLVSFEGGDPDRPIVTGRVFNGLAMPPYKLPEHRTKSVWRSCSSPGGDGFNEISMDDAAGSELIYIQAQRNLDRLVKNDATELTLGNQKHTVVGSVDILCQGTERKTINQDSHLTVHGSQRWLVDGNVSQTILQQRHTQIGVRDALEAGEEIHIRAGQRVVVEAGSKITLRTSGGFIDVHEGGVDVCGKMVRINSGGSPAAGSGGQPQIPEPAQPAAPVDPASITGSQQRITATIETQDEPP